MHWCIDMCADICRGHVFTSSRCEDMCEDMCVDMCADMCVDMCADMCADMCVHMCVHMYADMNTRQQCLQHQWFHVHSMRARHVHNDMCPRPRLCMHVHGTNDLLQTLSGAELLASRVIICNMALTVGTVC